MERTTPVSRPTDVASLTCETAAGKGANRQGFRVGERSRGRLAMPASSPLQDYSPFNSDVHVRRACLGFVHR
jgi:hypothetical protein